MNRRPKPGYALVFVFAGAFLHAFSGGASARSASQLYRAVKDARGESRALGRAPWNYDAEKALVDRIDRLADEFHELAAAGTPLQQTARELLALMEETRKRYTDVLEQMQAEVIRIDGDLEAVQDSPAWRQRELLAMRVLYRLNWVRYETAMRYERRTSERKRLLTEARNGFAEFLGTNDKDLANESLLGHGLTSKALKDYDTALEDFRTALANDPPPDLAVRLRVALADTLLTTGALDEALTVTRELVARATRGEERAQALFLRAKAALLALSKRRYGGASRQALVREAASAMAELYRRGGYWRTKVVQLVDAGVEDPGEWARVGKSPFVTWLIADSLRRRGQCDQAIELFRGLIQAGTFTTESLFGSGSCAYYESRYSEAIDLLGRFLETAEPDDTNRDQALYLRFKAAEALYLRTDDPAAKEQVAKQYLRFMRDFAEQAPDHASVFEAWFRLGEWHRDQGEYIKCAEAFANVRGHAGFAIKAAYLGAQCRVEAVLAYDDDHEPPRELVQAAIDALDAFTAEAEAYRAAHSTADTDFLAPLEAKAVVMAAAIVTRAGVGTMKDRLARLEGFERRFPDARELFPEVYSLRVVAYMRLARLDEAGSELESLLSFEGAGDVRYTSLKKLGVVFLEEASRRDEAGDAEGARRARRVALRIYERLLADLRGGRIRDAQASVEGLENLIAELRRKLDT